MLGMGEGATKRSCPTNGRVRMRLYIGIRICVHCPKRGGGRHAPCAPLFLCLSYSWEEEGEREESEIKSDEERKRIEQLS